MQPHSSTSSQRSDVMQPTNNEEAALHWVSELAFCWQMDRVHGGILQSAWEAVLIDEDQPTVSAFSCHVKKVADPQSPKTSKRPGDGHP